MKHGSHFISAFFRLSASGTHRCGSPPPNSTLSALRFFGRIPQDRLKRRWMSRPPSRLWKVVGERFRHEHNTFRPRPRKWRRWCVRAAGEIPSSPSIMSVSPTPNETMIVSRSPPETAHGIERIQTPPPGSPWETASSSSDDKRLFALCGA